MSIKRENLKEVNGVKVVEGWIGEALLDRIQEKKDDIFSVKLIRVEYTSGTSLYPMRAVEQVGK
jgi:hypothetical protein